MKFSGKPCSASRKSRDARSAATRCLWFSPHPYESESAPPPSRPSRSRCRTTPRRPARSAHPHRVKRALHRHRHEELRASGELLHVRIAAVLARRDRAQALLGHRSLAGHRGRSGGQHHLAAAIGQCFFSFRPNPQLLPRRRHPRRSHERAIRNAHAGKLRRGGVLGRDVPVRDEVVIEEIRQEAKPGREARPAVALRDDVDVLDLQEVARLRALHVHRPGERMRRRALELLQILGRRARPDLQIHRVARLERHLLARLHLDHRRDVWVPPVMSLVRLLAQPLRAIDAYAFWHSPRTNPS